MAEKYCNAFTRNLASNYVAGSGTLSVTAAAPAAVHGGTFRVRLLNDENTLLKVISGQDGTTWTVQAEANDADCASGASKVVGPELTAGMLDQLRSDWIGNDRDIMQWVDFTQTVGTFAPDISGNHNHAWLSENNSISSQGVTTSNNSYIDPGRVVMGRFHATIGIRFKTTQSSAGSDPWNHPTLYGMALNASGYDFGMHVHNGKVGHWMSFYEGGETSLTSNVVVNDDNWHSVVLTYDGASFKTYVDGINAGIDITRQMRYHFGDRPGSNVGLNPWMGRLNTWDFSGSVYGALNATFRTLKIWGRALTDLEIANLVWS